ncbi:MAG: right-handed parallel beta-helix repeat-containing protein [Chloroflexota bacterium]|nr:right-handed parallel beta-helix repeat-containing protein [Chloroflexota bacterium]
MNKSISLLAAFIILSSCNLPPLGSAANPTATSAVGSANSPTPILITDTPDRKPISVDSCGADPWDDLPDSDAIQQCINQAQPGDTVLFTSGVSQPGYRGYLINKTIYLVMKKAKYDLVFTASDPVNKPLLQATDDLKGYVVSLVARSRVPDYGRVDNITISHLQIDGNRENRICYGADELGNGLDDSWGSWIKGECSHGLCAPGTLNMCGASDLSDIDQDFQGNPDAWSTGLVVEDVHLSNTECASALPLCGAASMIKNSLIDTAGDKVLNPACQSTDPDEPGGDWADGITFEGPDNAIIGNTVIDASDVGIVFFGGRDTVISHNTVEASEGNHGMFAAIAIHPWGWGDVSGLEITNNSINNNASSICGGIHAGINIGTHMWNGGCIGAADLVAVGNPNHCSAEPSQPGGTPCLLGEPCQIWAYVAAGKTLVLQNNQVSGAQINYLVEGLDLVGDFIDSGNVSHEPRYTDWEGDAGCGMGGMNDRWGAHDFVAHHPTLPGWTDKRVHCEY